MRRMAIKRNGRTYARFLAAAAEVEQANLRTVKSAVGRYLKMAWKRGFSWEWEHYLDWHEEVPPTPMIAIRILCKGYLPFMGKYGYYLEYRKGYYIRLDIPDFQAKNT